MNFVYENQGVCTYLVYQISATDQLDTMSLGMLTNNQITGLAQTVYTQMDTEKFLKYNVSAKVSLKQFFSGQVSKYPLLKILSGITNALTLAEDYMINLNLILLDLDYIFVDVSTYEISMICLPINNPNAQNIDVTNFIRNIMFSTQFNQSEDTEHIVRIMNFLNGSSALSLVSLKKLLDELMLNAHNTQNNLNQNVQPASQPTPQPMSHPVQRPMQQPVQQPVPQQMSQPLQQPVQQPVAQPVQQPVYRAQPVVSQPSIGEEAGKDKGKKNKKDKKNKKQKAEKKDDKHSLMWLLRNYSKENLEIYREERDDSQDSPKANEPANKPVANMGFAIPGQESTIPSHPQPSTQQPVQSRPAPQQTETYNQQSTYQQQSYQQTSYQQSMYDQQPQQCASVNGNGNFGETVVLNVNPGAGETTALTQENNPNYKKLPYLIRMKTNEKVNINKPVFRIGKERSYVDYFIGDNTAISRSHANIIARGEQYFICDTNSTNHTFINAKMINSGEEVQLNDGDMVRLANEDFKFELD